MNISRETEVKERETIHGKGRSSLSSIPLPKIVNLYAIVNKSIDKKDDDDKVTKESENLCDQLCNGFRFVVNYGVFEPNFEV